MIYQRYLKLQFNFIMIKICLLVLSTDIMIGHQLNLIITPVLFNNSQLNQNNEAIDNLNSNKYPNNSDKFLQQLQRFQYKQIMKTHKQGLQISSQKPKSESKSTQKKIPATSPQKDKKIIEIFKKYTPSKGNQTIKEKKNKSKEHKQVNSSSKSRSKSKSNNKNLYRQYDSRKKFQAKAKQQAKNKTMKAVDRDQITKQQIQRCKIIIQEQKLEEASKILLKIVRNNSKCFDAFYYLGLINEKLGNQNQAKKHYRICIKLHSDQTNTLIAKDKKDKALKIRRQKQQIQKLIKLSKCYYYLNLYETVIEICIKVLQSTKQAQIYELKGKAQLARKKYGPAIDSFSNSLALNNNVQIYEYQGDCYRGIQAYELALNCYNKYSKILKTEPIRILQKKAQCFRLLGNKKKSEQIVQKIEKLRHEIPNQICIQIKAPHQIDKKCSAPTQINMKVDKSPELSFLPQLRPSTPSLQQVQQIYQKGNKQLSLKMVQQIIKKEGINLKNLYFSAFLLFQVQKYKDCESRINDAIKQIEQANKQIFSLSLSDSQEVAILKPLKMISNKLKQLNAFSLTEQQDAFIIQRRKRCLQEALNVFKNQQHDLRDSSLINSSLTVILQESSIVRSSRIYDTQQNSIFLLRYIRKVMRNWCDNKFSLQSIEQTTDLAFQLVKIRYKQFSILPMHIIYYTLRQQNSKKSFQEINEQINKVLGKVAKKYPPSEADISKSSLDIFDIEWQNKAKVDLFSTVFNGKKMLFKNFKELLKAIQIVADKAKQEFDQMNQICKQICIEKNCGFGFKIGLKVDRNSADQVEVRVLNRVIQKMLGNEIKQKAQSFFNEIVVKPNKKIYSYFEQIQKRWQQIIDQIIRQKNAKNQQIQCQIYDFMRAKCMFSSVRQMKSVVLQFIDLHNSGKIHIIDINNRLQYKTKDVVIKFKVIDIVGELQLALQFQSIQNQFNHGLYQLFRSPFGAFFASMMWFSGFSIKKNNMFFKQKIKWSMKGLEHLRKFIYEQELSILLINEAEQVIQQFILTEFQITSETITAYLCSKTHLYLIYNQETDQIRQQIEKPKQKFVIKLANQNFIIHESCTYQVQIRLQGTHTFFSFSGSAPHKLYVKSLQKSLYADLLTMKIKRHKKQKQMGKSKDSVSGLSIQSKQCQQSGQGMRDPEYNYAKQIEQCRIFQKSLAQLLNTMSN